MPSRTLPTSGTIRDDSFGRGSSQHSPPVSSLKRTPGVFAFQGSSRTGPLPRHHSPAADPGELNSQQRKARAWLIQREQNPTPEAITGVLNNKTSRQRRRRKQQAQKLIGPAVNRSGPAAAHCVAVYVEDNGIGPGWGELANQFGWPRSVSHVIIRELANRGWLTFTDEPRSLRPGPAFTTDQPAESTRTPGDFAMNEVRDRILRGGHTQ